MRILMVAIPNHHFFKWTQQLENSGFDVYWFDVSSSGVNSPQIPWVKQFTDWKLKWDFPLRSSIKKKLPKFYKFISNLNETDVNSAFNHVVNNVKPDIIHCFEMKLSGIPIQNALNSNFKIPLIYSSWGSDLFTYQKLGLTKNQVGLFLKRANYLITDCRRDFTIAKENGFKNEFLGVFPGNGGLKINNNYVLPYNERTTIIIKGYDDGVGQAIKVLKALEILSREIISKYKIVIYSADISVQEYINSSSFFKSLDLRLISRYQFLNNNDLLKLMGNGIIHIGNSISDGMPNALLEAMAMGCFPIQSNPGKVTEEVITNDFNGLLINNPLDEKEIGSHIKNVLMNNKLREKAYNFNVDYMDKNYNRDTLQSEIIQLYASISE